MNDTPPEIRKKQLEIIFSKTEEERFRMGLQMIDFVRQAARNRVREKNPGISELELKVEVFRQTYKEDFPPEEMEKIVQFMRNEYSKSIASS